MKTGLFPLQFTQEQVRLEYLKPDYWNIIDWELGISHFLFLAAMLH